GRDLGPGMKSRVQRGREHLARIIHGTCAIETDVRGHVVECDPRALGGCGDRLHPSPRPHDSMDMRNMDMKHTNPTLDDETAANKQEAASGCCGSPAPKASGACCALDAEVKEAGGLGCGCGPKTAPASPASPKGCC